MKVLLIVTVACLMSGAQASAIGDTLKSVGTSIGGIFTDLFANLKEPLTQVTSQLVDNLKQAGTSLLSTGAQSLLGSLSKVGTRDVSGVTQVLKQTEAKVHKLAENLGFLYNSAMTKLTEIGSKVANMEFLKEPIGNLINEVNELVDNHGILQNGILKAITGLFNNPKRNLNLLAALESQFAELFKPAIDAVTNHVGVLGSQLINTATTLSSAIQPALLQMGQDLGGHFQALKDSSAELLAQKA